MRGAAALVLVLAACSPEPVRRFGSGFLGPLSTREEAQARAAGLDVARILPSGAVEIGAADEQERTLPAQRLRFLVAEAVARGASGVYLRSPRLPPLRQWVDYPEEWRAATAALREPRDMRLVLESGQGDAPPFPVEPILLARAWTHVGRRYVLLVNPSTASVRLDAAAWEGARALFEVRSDPREALVPCGGGLCLPAQSVLWLEGRPFAEATP